MRNIIIIIFAVVVLGALNFAIYEKERIKANSEVVYLELAPVDPRSLMQGDYMRLRYQLERDAGERKQADDGTSRALIIKPDENRVARLVGFHARDTKLQDGEKLVKIIRTYRSVEIRPDTFLFQEGHAKFYDRAKYGVFRFDNASNYLLVGLADENRVLISPE